MAYGAHGRPLWQVIATTMFCGFLVGFTAVLCIGNYYRAKRAMERQRQRRMSKMSEADSPRSLHSSATTSAGSIDNNTNTEHQHLLRGDRQRARRNQQQGDLLQLYESQSTPQPIRV